MEAIIHFHIELTHFFYAGKKKRSKYRNTTVHTSITIEITVGGYYLTRLYRNNIEMSDFNDKFREYLQTRKIEAHANVMAAELVIGCYGNRPDMCLLFLFLINLM